MTARYIVGDAFDALATLEADSVDLIFSSPPFLALRSYLPADHPDKAKEIGSEPTPVKFLDTLLDVVEACDRVLAPHGSLCFELGDTYSGSGGAGGDYGTGGLRDGQAKFNGSALADRKNKVLREDGNRLQQGEGWPLAKSLCMIPTLFAASLAYGHNMLRPERTTPRWRVRNQIVWARPNPPVGALGDKYRPATSYVTVATKSAARYFDLDAVREPYSDLTMKVKGEAWANGDRGFKTGPKAASGETGRPMAESRSTHAGAPPLDYWVIPTHPYPGAHYATFPPELVVRPVKSMCPQRVCRVCGEPSRRITSDPEYVAARQAFTDETAPGTRFRDADDKRMSGTKAPAWKHQETLGWTDCGCELWSCSHCGPHPASTGTWCGGGCGRDFGCMERVDDHWRPGLVLDPFAGSGTTLAVATGHGRDAIGIDLDERNAELALDRVGPMFLTVEHLSDEGAA